MSKPKGIHWNEIDLGDLYYHQELSIGELTYAR